MSLRRTRAKAIVHPSTSKAESRLATLSSPEILNWSEGAVNSVHAALDAYRRSPEVLVLDDVEQSLAMLQGALNVLRTR